MFKSTLVFELNGNPFLSKERLTRVRNSVYLNNAEEYMSAANSENTCLHGLGFDCAVYFVSNSAGPQTSAARAAKRRNGRRRVGAPSNIGKGALEKISGEGVSSTFGLEMQLNFSENQRNWPF